MKNNQIDKKRRVGIIIGTLIIFAIGISIYSSKIFNSSDGNKYPDYVQNTVVNQEFLDSMDDKDLIFYKIVNSIDFYKNAYGEYSLTDNTNQDFEKIKYYADIASGKSYTSSDKKIEIICKDNRRLTIDNNNNSYYENPLIGGDVDENVAKLKPKDRYDKSKDNSYIFRYYGGYLDSLSKTLFNQELQSYLKDYSDWNIVGEKSYLNRMGIEISGQLNYTSKTGENKFKIVIDKETGIILKYEILDKEDNVVHSMVTSNIEIDGGISSEVFDKDLTSYDKK